MRLHWRSIVVSACTLVFACREAVPQRTFSMPGRNAAALITPAGDRDVVYVDPATRRLMHQRLGDDRPAAISPAGDVVDLRGENAPLFTSRADGALLVVYPIALPAAPGASHHHSIGELRAQLSRDGGRTWSAPRRIDGDRAPRGHNFADLAMGRNGEAVVSWLDSREGQQGVQTAVLRSDLSIANARTADAKTCQCCRTALFTASNGAVWLAYRDLAEGNIRNMAYAVSAAAGQPFVARGDVADDRWSVNGCPESGPRFAETADGTVWLAWFNGAAQAIELAAAPRGGRFSRRATIATGGVNHPDLGTLPDGRLVVFYEAFHGVKRSIEARVSDASHGRWGGPVTVVDGESPRYVRLGAEALLSYEDAARVHVIDPLPRIVR
jgi:hypothetical protein